MSTRPRFDTFRSEILRREIVRDADVAAARRLASLRPADGAHLPAVSAAAEELIAAVGLEPRHAHAYRHPDSGGPRGFRLVVELITLALLWQIFAADERDGIPKSVFQ